MINYDLPEAQEARESMEERLKAAERKKNVRPIYQVYFERN